jgi:UDP-2,3-diacylglucosamine pyrophosphatase LpxH
MNNTTSPRTKLHVVAGDFHYPEHDGRAFKALLEFLKVNKRRIASFTLNGDGLDCQDISRHTEGKPRLRRRGGWKEAIDGFREDILDRLDEVLPKSCKKVFIAGNHEDWLQDLLDKQPELEGLLEIPNLLRLEERGWTWKECGEHIERAGFVILHGDQIGSDIHVAKKAGDLISGNVIMSHVHRLSMFSRAALVSEKKKHLAVTLPCMCTVAPTYAKGQPNAFVVGFGIIEEWAVNRANVYSPVIIDGVFAYGGQLYGRK